MRFGVAVIGVGDVARRDYLPEFDRLGARARLTIACARRAERAEEACRAFGFDGWTTDYREALAADDVDVVLNLTPFPLHAEVTIAALEAGKHVYSEKPIATDVAEVRNIAAAAAARGLTVVAAPSVLLFPQLMRAQEILTDRRLGPIHSARAYAFGGIPPWDGYISDPSPFFAAGAGPLADMAVYPLHALTGLLGPAAAVTAMSSRTRASFFDPVTRAEIPVETADNWHLIVRLESGLLASIEANNSAAIAGGPELELLGEEATLGLSLLDVSQPLRVFSYDGEVVEPVAHERTAGPDHILGVAHLLDAIEQHREPVLSVHHADHVLAIIEAARESALTGRAVDVAPSLGWRGLQTMVADA